MTQLLSICVASGIGGGTRYLLGLALMRALGPAFPYGTLAVNLLGSFLIAAVMYAGLEAGLISPQLRATLAVGLLGGFTTYSAFSFETLAQLQTGAWGLAALNLLLTIAGCLLACWLGWQTAQWLVGG